jgi:hypothetical protein
MKSLFKSLGLLGLCVTAGLWSSAQEVKNPKPLIDFSEQNFGVGFCHTTNISTTYNPHGGADRVFLSYRNKPLGGLMIRPAPPAESIKEFIESGKDHYKERWGASTVDHEEYENPAKYKFHQLKAEVKQNGEDYVLVRYVYLRGDSRQPSDVGEKVILSMSGAFSFEFAYLKKEQESLKLEIKTIIDTFKIADVSSSGTKKNDQPAK